MIKESAWLIITLLISLGLQSVSVSAKETKGENAAIVLAAFGTSYPEALTGIMNIKKRVEDACPGVPVKVAFTSNMIRKIWHKRIHDKDFKAANKSLPPDIFSVKGPLATIADLQDKGYSNIIVQSLHIYNGEEYDDLVSYVKGLEAIKTLKTKNMPFERLAIGRPALGANGDVHPYIDDIKEAARAVAEDVREAQRKKAALVYMGHGNKYYSSGAYAELQDVMRSMYPDAKIFIGTVEGFPSFDQVMDKLKAEKIRKVLLKPFMEVAGDHARNDMAGDANTSWKRRLESAGIKVVADIHGLSENDAFADIFVRHIKDAAKDSGIEICGEK
ncbi:sirohydrochlorin cobaltochelatase [Dissulfurimicrobium hydrothermale]|uniref:sirohydrochlorin cobaltochelatase n=1 Tax=Dissulfurimicrobium hydrothermale TaxID=1750598 RepID=UPI001EDA152E|nr:sirohydrochlorin cobaltochelatase [Dissulfurimicrobium hydrothermale]UKL13068.1 sirohydrochlorin cobaltochelatase [Dissulfurimicrobium hydrothermale]